MTDYIFAIGPVAQRELLQSLIGTLDLEVVRWTPDDVGVVEVAGEAARRLMYRLALAQLPFLLSSSPQTARGYCTVQQLEAALSEQWSHRLRARTQASDD